MLGLVTCKCNFVINSVVSALWCMDLHRYSGAQEICIDSQVRSVGSTGGRFGEAQDINIRWDISGNPRHFYVSFRNIYFTYFLPYSYTFLLVVDVRRYLPLITRTNIQSQTTHFTYNTIFHISVLKYFQYLQNKHNVCLSISFYMALQALWTLAAFSVS
jgi:hypothetical protein